MADGHDSAMLGYGSVFQCLTSTVTMNLGAIFHLRGANFTVGAACASSTHAIGLAAMLVRQGLQDVVLCGGAQETNLLSLSSFDALQVFSMRMDAPTAASRPFDRHRDGLVPSGGAAALVVEDYDHAVARGARIIAEVAGYGFSGNGGGISSPDERGCRTAMERALDDAGCLLATSTMSTPMPHRHRRAMPWRQRPCADSSPESMPSSARQSR